jgi:signal recognition particle subunit SRP54
VALFENLTDRLQASFQKLRGHGQITEGNVKDTLREVRMALLEADVSLPVAKEFINRVTEKASGESVLTAVSPGQQMVKIIHDELVEFLGGAEGAVPFAPQKGKLTVILMLGLQGSGKTTFCGKLARRLKGQGFNPMLVACDIHRPAAVEQLHVVGKSAGVAVYSEGVDKPAHQIAARGVAHGRENGHDLVIVDTAGRLHIDDVKMDELLAVKDAVEPDYSFFVADAMTGQDAVKSASTFQDKIGLDGVCLTKMDGDARGGAALSIKWVTGKPVKFVGVGEKLEDLEEFFPDRVASRILGMGDIVSLVEKAQENFDEKEAKELERKMRKASFTFSDFLNQMRQLRKMGPLRGILEMIPGMGQALKGVDLDDKHLKRVEAIILSMTLAERDNPDIIQVKRRERIAKGSGVTPAEVTGLIDQFLQMRKMMQQMMKVGDAMKGMKPGPDGQMPNPGDLAGIMGGGGGNVSAAERAKRQKRKDFEKQQKKAQAKRNRQKKR